MNTVNPLLDPLICNSYIITEHALQRNTNLTRMWLNKTASSDLAT